MVQPPWKIVWRFHYKLNIELPYNLVISLPGRYLDKTIIQKSTRSSCHGLVVTNPTSIHEYGVQSLALPNGLRIWHCHELWHSLQMWLRSKLLWLWHRLAAVVLIQPLAWELPYAEPAALKRQNKKQKNACTPMFIAVLLTIAKT